MMSPSVGHAVCSAPALQSSAAGHALLTTAGIECTHWPRDQSAHCHIFC